jgi:BMFP domain-containing protein YqiC
MKSSVIYIPETNGSDPRLIVTRELMKLQRVIAEISGRLEALDQRVAELEKKHAE